MTFEIVIGWWIIPAIITVLILCWCFQPDYSGGRGIAGGFIQIIALLGISLVWLIYTAIGWALS